MREYFLILVVISLLGINQSFANTVCITNDNQTICNDDGLGSPNSGFSVNNDNDEQARQIERTNAEIYRNNQQIILNNQR